MRIAVLSTKGGVGKSTSTANIGALLADAGKRVLLVDLDTQPTLTSLFPLASEAPDGIYGMLLNGETRPEKIISQTIYPNLSVIISNDAADAISPKLLNAANGRFKLRQALDKLSGDFDVVLIDTRGTQSITVQMALLAADLALSPVVPEMLVAREFERGTMQLFGELETYEELFHFKLPKVSAFLNRVDQTSDSKTISDFVRQSFAGQSPDARIKILDAVIPSAVAFRNAATVGLPAHRFEHTAPKNSKRDSLMTLLQRLACEVFPQWKDDILAVDPANFKTLPRANAGA
jgi:chromosome partitioning related protein ParA